MRENPESQDCRKGSIDSVTAAVIPEFSPHATPHFIYA